MVPFQATFWTTTLRSSWANSPFQPLVIACPLGNENCNVQRPFVGTVPVLLMRMLTWKLPGHCVVIVYVTRQLVTGTSPCAKNTFGGSSSSEMSELAAITLASVMR